MANHRREEHSKAGRRGNGCADHSQGAAARARGIDVPDILRRLREFYRDQPPVEER